MSAKTVQFGIGNGLKIWAVDDAWFNSSVFNTPIYDALLRTGLSENQATISDLVKAIQVLQEAENAVVSWADVSYLSELAKNCERLGESVVLHLANFEYFETQGISINQRRHAVLLDVHEANQSGGNNSRGILLLKETLNGQRPLADFAFITGNVHEVTKAIDSNRSDKKWWPVRSVPSVDKSSVVNLKKDLEAFFDFFVQGLESDPVRNLACFLHRIQEAEAINENASHPNTLDEIPKDAPFLQCYDRDQTPCESFKSLYRSSHADGGQAMRTISATLLASHLESVAQVELEEKSEQRLTLPCKPGVIFVLNLFKFLRETGAGRSDRPKVKIWVDQKSGSCGVNVELANAERFRHSVLGNGGTLTKAFRDLLISDLKLFNESIQTKASYLSRWNCPSYWSEDADLRATPRLCVEPEWSSSGVVLKWFHPVSQREWQ